jgi:phosphoglycolate phosphatase-like HAD superfamily hydrolase
MKPEFFKTWVFDCDGVILDSNHLKTDAFYEVALPYGKENAEKFIQYHKNNGGISRYEKFFYFFQSILQKSDFTNEMNAALAQYAKIIREKLSASSETDGVRDCLNNLSENAIAIIVSGGNQDEIREIFHLKGLDFSFSGIFGSPIDKKTIIHSLLTSKYIVPPVIFIGDSRYDYEVAKFYNFSFVFMSQYSEFKDWEEFFSDKPDVKIIENLSYLFEIPESFFS